VVQDGSLRTAKKFNHKLRDKYILQIRVFDNGTPPLFSDTYGTKRRTSVHFFVMLDDFVTQQYNVADPGCLSRIRTFLSRIQGLKKF
jgi:hypothetical protein